MLYQVLDLHSIFSRISKFSQKVVTRNKNLQETKNWISQFETTYLPNQLKSKEMTLAYSFLSLETSESVLLIRIKAEEK